MNTYKDEGEGVPLPLEEGKRNLGTSESTYLKCKDASPLLSLSLSPYAISLSPSLAPRLRYSVGDGVCA